LSYDVPAKLFSLHLLLMGVFLVLPDARLLLDVFVLRRPSRPVPPVPLFHRRWANLAVMALQVVLLFYWSGTELYRWEQARKTIGDEAPRPPLYGIYSVDEFRVNGQERPPRFDDPERWRHFTVDIRVLGYAVLPASGPIQRYSGKIDQQSKTLELTQRGAPRGKFTYTTPSPETLMLDGEMDGKKIQAKLRKLDEKSLLLNSRGFHWFSEFPDKR